MLSAVSPLKLISIDFLSSRKAAENINRTSIPNLCRLFTSAQVFFLWHIMIKCFLGVWCVYAFHLFVNGSVYTSTDRPLQVAKETVWFWNDIWRCHKIKIIYKPRYRWNKSCYHVAMKLSFHGYIWICICFTMSIYEYT